MAISTAIKNCRVVGPDRIIDAGIGIEGERIAFIGRDGDIPPAENVIDAGGNYVLPGLVDPHFHMGYPFDIPLAEALRRDSSAAVAGGVTTGIQNVRFSPAGPLAGARDLVAAFERNCFFDLGLNAVIANDENIRDIPALLDFGMPAIKLLAPYRGAEVVVGMAGIDDGVMYLAYKEMGRLAKEGYKVFARTHCESGELAQKLKHEYVSMREEPVFFNDARPNIVEAQGMVQYIYMAWSVNCPIYVVHMSIREGPGIVTRFRQLGAVVMCETCPQYLALNVDNCDRLLSKTIPPVRHKEDNEALWRAIADGVIDCVGSDNGATSKTKKQSILDGMPGITGPEIMLPVMLSEGVNKGRIALEKAVELCCYNPARIYGIAPRKGVLDIGSDADLVIVDMKKRVKVTNDILHNGVDYTVWEGFWLTGWPILTMLRGNVVMREGEILGKAGCGRYIPAKVR